jgi:hypothetical protein
MTGTTSAAVDFSQQAGYFDVRAFGHGITMIGCGGIGGSLLPVLATMGVPNITVYDPDRVEWRNVASTLMFGPADVGLLKVEVAERELTRLGVANVTVHPRAFDGPRDRGGLRGIVISGVDSMSTRKSIWQTTFTDPVNTDVALYVDCRTGGSSLTVCVVEPWEFNTVAWYERFQLFDDAQAVVAPRCGEVVAVNTRRNITFTPVAQAAFVASLLARFSRGESLPRMVVADLNTLDLEESN